MKFLLMSFLLLAAARSFAEGSLKIHYQDKVRENNSKKTAVDNNFAVMFAPESAEKDSGRQDCLALRIRRRGTKFFWRPTWHYIDAGKVLFADCVQSADKSVIALAEHVGKVSDAVNTRIIFIDSASMKVIQAVELPRLDVGRIVFGSDDTLYALVKAQSKFKQQPQLLKINCREAKITAAKVLGGEAYDMLYVPGSDQIIISFKKIKKLTVISLNKFSRPAQNYKISGEKAALCMKDGKLFFALDSGVFQYNFFSGDSEKITALPQVKVSRLYSFGPSMLLFAQSGKVYSVVDRRLQVLCPFSEPSLCCNTRDSLVFLPSGKKGYLESFSIPRFELMEKIPTNRLKPRTKGSVAFMIYLGGDKRRIMVFDNHGNIYVVYAPKRSWRKKMLFSAVK